MINDKKTKTDLNDKDFYDQACAYFYYHAEQRTTMINYFIAVFAASIALYGSLIVVYPLASVFVALFLLVVSLLFYRIDLRNRFDVKQSQNVIAQIERDYKMDVINDGADYAYGVFSNEDNTFRYYGRASRKESDNENFMILRELYLNEKKLRKKGEFKEADKLENEFEKKKKEFLSKTDTISEKEFMNSIKSGSIVNLSVSIKWLYYICMGMSSIGIILGGVISVLKYLI